MCLHLLSVDDYSLLSQGLFGMDDYPYRAHDLPIFSQPPKKNDYRCTFSEEKPRLEEVFLRYQEDPSFEVYTF